MKHHENCFTSQWRYNFIILLHLHSPASDRRQKDVLAVFPAVLKKPSCRFMKKILGMATVFLNFQVNSHHQFQNCSTKQTAKLGLKCIIFHIKTCCDAMLPQVFHSLSASSTSSISVGKFSSPRDTITRLKLFTLAKKKNMQVHQCETPVSVIHINKRNKT